MANEGLRVIADIGGTNARFALARNGTYDRLIHVEVARYTSLHDALLDYLNDLPPALWPSEGAIAVAGPVLGDHVALTNLAWSFSTSDLKRSLGLGALKVFNDFAATAMAVPYLPQKDVFPIGPPNRDTQGPVGIIGPGTGLGVSSLVPHGGRWVMVAGEGGHVTLPASTSDEGEIIAVLRRRWDHVSAERVLSGSGLVNLYQAVCAVEGKSVQAFIPADVTAHAVAGTNAECVRAFALFCALLGTVAGDLALTVGARGGVYIAGGILLRFKEAFAASAFRARFEAKGRFANYLRAIPTCLILEESPALLGLSKAPLD